MAINQRLDLKQSQNLTMTPQLQQAIKLLQLSNIELSEFVETELEKNPLLERDDGQGQNDQDDRNKNDDPSLSDSRSTNTDDDSFTDKQRGELDTDFENVWTGESMAEKKAADPLPDYDAGSAAIGSGGNLKFDNPDFSLENTLSSEKTLRDHLEDQISIDFSDETERMIALLMIDYLDQSGYLRMDIAEVADRLGGSAEKLEKIILRLQNLDPPGIFARSLSECLALQLKEKNRLDPAMQTLLDNLELLGAHDLKKLKDLCRVDDEDLKDMIFEIKSLDPKPALQFDHFVSQTVIPDVLMKALPKDKGGGWGVELNSDTLPRVLVNKTYYTEVSKTAKSKQEKEYLSEQMATASWLVKALDQRAQTILKVSAAIIEQQDAFFNYGVEYLKPLVLRDVAEMISMHESTVSRVTTNKYIGTPRGVFELKYFFSSGVSSASGAEFASGAVQARIKSLTDAESPDDILSDDDIVTLLKKEGIDIARRTVAKYRDAMKIPSSVQRRRAKKQQKS